MKYEDTCKRLLQVVQDAVAELREADLRECEYLLHIQYLEGETRRLRSQIPL